MGLAAGGAAVLFHNGIHWLNHWTYGYLRHGDKWRFAAGTLVVIVAASALVGFLLNKVCPAASGSGSRKLIKHNFYEAILVQDGHNLEHFIPPRDLRSWQQLPVSAIANFQPVLLPSLEESVLRDYLKRYPYQLFPVVEEGRPAGMLTRREAELSLEEKRDPRLDKAYTCPPNYSVRRLQQLLIESPNGMVLLQESASGKVIGLVTLHDLLRAEVAMAETGVG